MFQKILTWILVAFLLAVLAIGLMLYSVWIKLSPPDRYMEAYSVKTVLSFHYNGVPVSAYTVTKCQIVEVGGGFVDYGTNPRQVTARTVAGENLHILLPDGSALVVFNAKSCPWTVMPYAGTKTLTPYDRHDPLPEGLTLEKVTWGEVAWLDGPSMPRTVRTTDLSTLATGWSPSISNLIITASLTDEQPSKTLAADIPALIQLDWLSQYRM